MNSLKFLSRAVVLVCCLSIITFLDCKSQSLNPVSKKYSHWEKELQTLIGTQAEAWIIKEGNFVTLAELKGSVIFLEFYNNGCGHSVKAESDVQKIDSLYKANNLKTVIIRMLGFDEEHAQIDFCSKKDPYISQTSIIDYEDISKKYKIEAFPTFILIDKKGIIRFTQLGDFDKDRKSKMIKEISTLL